MQGASFLSPARTTLRYAGSNYCGMNVFSHGGDLKSLAEEACRPERDILDFSVNLRPEGMPEFIASALWKAMENAVPYPSPDAADLRELAAVHYGLPSGCFVFGNGPMNSFTLFRAH